MKVKEGEAISVPCEAIGYPKPSINFRFEDNIVDFTKNLINNNWERKNLKKSEEGMYECVASNGVDDAISRMFRISVLGMNSLSLQIFCYSRV